MKGAEGLGLDAKDVKDVEDTSVVLRVSQAQLDLEACLTWPVAELVRDGAAAEVDFGLFVTSGGSLSLSFTPAAAAVFERVGVTLVVRAYPTSDDDD